MLPHLMPAESLILASGTGIAVVSLAFIVGGYVVIGVLVHVIVYRGRHDVSFSSPDLDGASAEGPDDQ